MNIFNEVNGDRVVVRRKMRRAKHKGGDFIVQKIKTPANLSWKKNFIQKVVELSSNISENMMVDEYVEAEDVENFDMVVDDDWDLELLENIAGDRLPADFIHLFDENN